MKSTAVTLNTGWLALPGQQLDFAEITSNSSTINATTEATSQAVITGNQVYYDGSRVKVSLFVPKLTSAASLTATFVVYRGSTVVGQVFGGTVNTTSPAIALELFDTPSTGAGAYVYAVKAFVSGSALTVNAGLGGSGNLLPGWLSVTKA